MGVLVTGLPVVRPSFVLVVVHGHGFNAVYRPAGLLGESQTVSKVVGSLPQKQVL